MRDLAKKAATARAWKRRTGRFAEPHPEESTVDRHHVRYSITPEGRAALEAARRRP